MVAGDTRKGIYEKAGGNWANVIPTKGGRKEESGGSGEGDRRKKKKSVMGRKRKGSSTGFDT